MKRSVALRPRRENAYQTRLLLETLEDRRLLSINWSGLADGTSWGLGGNWVGGMVPGATDDAMITAGAGTAVVFSSGTTTVKSLTCSKDFSITGGSFNVTANS